MVSVTNHLNMKTTVLEKKVGSIVCFSYRRTGLSKSLEIGWMKSRGTSLKLSQFKTQVFERR